MVETPFGPLPDPVHDDTTGRGLPLPHPSNPMRTDAYRIRLAIEGADAATTALEGRIASLEQSVGAAATGDPGKAVVIQPDGTGLATAWRAPEPMGEAFTLSPADATGAASVVVAGYPAGFGAARVEVTGDLEVAVNGGAFGTARISAANGDTVTVRPAGALADGQTYSGSLNIGARQASYSFTYVAAYIATPSVTAPADGAIDQPEQPVLTLSAYDVLPGSGLDAAHPHVSTDWQVTLATDTAFAAPVWQSLADTTNKVTVTLPAGVLTVATAYIARARFRAADLVSAYATVTVTTAASWGSILLFVPTIFAGHIINGTHAVTNNGRTVTMSSGAIHAMHSPAGKVAWEVAVGSVSGSGLGIGTDSSNADYPFRYVTTGHVYVGGTQYGPYATYGAGDRITVAVDEPNGKVWFAKNGVWLSGDPSTGTGGFSGSRRGIHKPYSHGDGTLTYNCGHEAPTYAYPAGFAAGPGEYVVSTDVDAVFRSVLYTGTGAAATKWHGLPMAAGDHAMLWLKARAQTYSARVIDTVRGLSQSLFPDQSVAQQGEGAITSLSSGCFSLTNHTYTNGSAEEFGAFVFKKAPKFFDVVTYTGDGAAGRQIAHTLGVTPGMIIFKRLNTSTSWVVFHRALGPTTGLTLNNADSKFSAVTYNCWNSTESTSTNFTLGNYGDTNASGAPYVAYLFAHDTAAASKIKCGSYVGTGAAGLEVNVGWPVQWLLIKVSDAGGAGNDWMVFDLASGGLCHGMQSVMWPNLPNTGLVSASVLEPSPTGFRVLSTHSSLNQGTLTYVYVAIRRGPMVSHDQPQQVYQGISYTGTGGARDLQGVGFRADMSLNHLKTVVASRNATFSCLSRKSYIQANSNAAMGTQSGRWWELYPDGTRRVTNGDNEGSVDYRMDVLRHCPEVFTSLVYTSTNAVQTVPHDLGVIPDLMIDKMLSGPGSWRVYHKDLGASQLLTLEESTAAQAGDYWGGTAPTSALATVNLGGAGSTRLLLLFASKAGMSKVGSFTVSGMTATVICGFRPRFILHKASSDARDWRLWTAEMGLSDSASPTAEPYFAVNTNTVESTGDDLIDTTATGFVVKGLSDGNFVFLALA